MSLNPTERDNTRAELAANLELSGLTPGEISGALNLPTSVVEDCLELTSRANPALVWRIRDYMESVIRERGIEPVPYSRLTEAMRASAQAWFGIE